jgi:hypothetical protein
MAGDDVTPSNPLVAVIEKEKFNETSFDVNVFQRSHDEKPFKRVVRA